LVPNQEAVLYRTVDSGSVVGLLEKNVRNPQCLFCGMYMRDHSTLTDAIHTANPNHTNLIIAVYSSPCVKTLCSILHVSQIPFSAFPQVGRGGLFSLIVYTFYTQHLGSKLSCLVFIGQTVRSVQVREGIKKQRGVKK